MSSQLLITLWAEKINIFSEKAKAEVNTISVISSQHFGFGLVLLEKKAKLLHLQISSVSDFLAITKENRDPYPALLIIKGRFNLI